MRSIIAASAVLAALTGAASIDRSGALAQSAKPAVATVHIRDFAYQPKELRVGAGAAVTFVNDDAEAHTVTADDKSFDSEGLDTHATWTHTFTKPGTYTYFCELHPYMKGTIVVAPPGAGGSS